MRKRKNRGQRRSANRQEPQAVRQESLTVRPAAKTKTTPSKPKKQVFTSKTASFLQSLKEVAVDLLRFLLTLLVYAAKLLPFAIPFIIGVIFLQGVFPYGEDGQRVFGIFLALYGIVTGVMTFITESYVRGVVQGTRLMSTVGVLMGLYYFLYGAHLIAAFLLPISLLIGVGVHFLHKRLYGTKTAETEQ